MHASDNYPVTNTYLSVGWLALMALLAFLMVSTWRYWSFKELNLNRPRSPLLLVLMCGTIYAIWNWSQAVLLIMAGTYVASGLITRAAGIIRRYTGPKKPMTTVQAETNIG